MQIFSWEKSSSQQQKKPHEKISDQGKYTHVHTYILTTSWGRGDSNPGSPYEGDQAVPLSHKGLDREDTYIQS